MNDWYEYGDQMIKTGSMQDIHILAEYLVKEAGIMDAAKRMGKGLASAVGPAPAVKMVGKPIKLRSGKWVQRSSTGVLKPISVPAGGGIKTKAVDWGF